MKIPSITALFSALILSANTFAVPQQKTSPVRLDGMIRMANHDRLAVGDTAPIRVRLMHTGGTGAKSLAKVMVVVKLPNGSTVNQGTQDIQVPFNEYAEANFDFNFPSAGRYTAIATATGENGSKWSGNFSFTTFGKANTNSKGPATSSLEAGTYETKIDIRLPSGKLVNHTISLTLSKSHGSTMTMKGWIAPNKGKGFHFQLSGTWAGINNPLSPIGIGTDAADQNCTAKLSLVQRSNNSLQGDLSIAMKSTPVIINHVILGKN